jgi:hypothetical protein
MNGSGNFTKRLLKSGILPTRLYRLLSIFLIKERSFLLIIMAAFLLAAIFHPYPHIAMWIGFTFAAYSATANDSIQTIGTFLASNYFRKWYVLWGFIATIFLITVTYSWFQFNGDVSYERLSTDGLDKTPETYDFLQIAAPIFLMILTRMRMPVSTTFLLLSIFSTKSSGIIGMLEKSMWGYLIAFVVALVVWSLLHRIIKKLLTGEAHPGWSIAQWVSSGALWAVWIMQDAANVAVYLPRSLDGWSFLLFCFIFITGLGVLFFLKGDKIQHIVSEKTAITDVRAATIIDFIYAIILFFFKSISKVPMSTTWVFIGLLGGRELAINFLASAIDRKNRFTVFKMILKDILLAFIGLLVSVILAISINRDLRAELLSVFN